MVGVAMYITIKTLWERCKNKSKIARLTGHDWKTVAKMIKAIEEGKEYPSKKPHPRVLDPYKEQIIKWMEEELTGVRIHEELQGMGVKVGYSTVKDYISKIRKRENVFVRIHTLAGEEAQVDGSLRAAVEELLQQGLVGGLHGPELHADAITTGEL